MNGTKMSPTMAIVGCGRLGTAILKGLLNALTSSETINDNVNKSALPARFLACVRTDERATALESQLAPFTKPDHKPSVQVWRGRNVQAAGEAAVVLLACQPPQLPGILAEDGMADALRGKLVLSICVGISEAAIRQLLYGAADDECHIVHAMPNPASMVGASATVLNEREVPLPPQYEVLVGWIFGSIGTVTKVAPHLMNAASIAAGSTAGFVGPMLMGITAGAVAAGMQEDVALRMAAQAIKGTAEMILQLGETPEAIMDKVSTPGGCTERGLRRLMSEEATGSVPAAFAKAMEVAIARAFELGGE